MPASFDLQRFLVAQDPVYARVRAELRAGRKTSHWMWFIFPQLAGLGYSAMAQRYAISGLAEARAYLAHPVLGARLRDCAGLVAAIETADIDLVFGTPDNLKFHASMTLFAHAAAAAAGADADADAAHHPASESVFAACLRKFFHGKPHAATVAALGKA